MGEYKRLTKEKSTSENTKIVYNENGFAIMSKELVDMLLQEHNCLWEIENKIENGTLKEEKVCVWEEWEDDAIGSVWNCSNCKEDFCFMEGGVNEYNYGYCPHCGAKIVALKELKGEV